MGWLAVPASAGAAIFCPDAGQIMTTVWPYEDHIMDTERPVDGLYENRCPFVGLCGDHEMVTIWTFRAQIMTTPAGIIAIRAGFFYSRSARQALIMLFLGKLFYCYSVCYTFSTACHSPPNLVEKIENFTLINEQKKVGFQHCWKFQQGFLRKPNFFQQRFPAEITGKPLFAARLHSHRRKT